MNNIIDSVAKVLLYKGPSLHEIINEATINNYEYDIVRDRLTTRIIIKSTLVYSTNVIDEYTYDNDGNLIKHNVRINNKERVVFDKYEDTKELIRCLDKIKETA